MIHVLSNEGAGLRGGRVLVGEGDAPQGEGWGREKKGRRMVLNVKTLKTGFGIPYVISPLPCKYPDASLLKSTFPRPGSDLLFCSSASPRGSRRGRGIPMTLYMLCCLLECSSSCPLICLLVIINTTLMLKIAKVTLCQAPC